MKIMKTLDSIKKKVTQKVKDLESFDKQKIFDVVEQATQVGVQEVIKFRQEVHEKIVSNPQFQAQKEKWIVEAKKLRECAEATILQVKKNLQETLEGERKRRGRRS
jgi:hypothetical protein